MTCLESPVVFSSASSLSPPPAGSGPAALQDEQQGKQADDGQEKEREEGESGELADVLQELAATRAERDGLLQLATVQVRHCLSRPSTQPFFFKAPPFACVSTAFLPSETAAPSLAAVQNQQLLQLAARAATPTGGGTGSRGDEVLPALQVPSFGVLSLPFHCLSLCFRCAFTAPINVLSPPFHCPFTASPRPFTAFRCAFTALSPQLCWLFRPTGWQQRSLLLLLLLLSGAGRLAQSQHRLCPVLPPGPPASTHTAPGRFCASRCADFGVSEGRAAAGGHGLALDGNQKFIMEAWSVDKKRDDNIRNLRTHSRMRVFRWAQKAADGKKDYRSSMSHWCWCWWWWWWWWWWCRCRCRCRCCYPRGSEQASQPMQQTWAIIQRDGTNRLGLWPNRI